MRRLLAAVVIFVAGCVDPGVPPGEPALQIPMACEKPPSPSSAPYSWQELENLTRVELLATAGLPKTLKAIFDAVDSELLTFNGKRYVETDFSLSGPRYMEDLDLWRWSFFLKGRLENASGWDDRNFLVDFPGSTEAPEVIHYSEIEWSIPDDLAAKAKAAASRWNSSRLSVRWSPENLWAVHWSPNWGYCLFLSYGPRPPMPSDYPIVPDPHHFLTLIVNADSMQVVEARDLVPYID